jgi:hypothetical protein
MAPQALREAPLASNYGRPLEATLNDNTAPPMPLAITPAMAPFAAPQGPRSTGAGMPRVDVSAPAPQATPVSGPASGPSASTPGVSTSSPSMPGPAPAETSAPPKKRSRAPLVILLLLLVLGGAAGGLWVAVNHFGLALDLGGANPPAKHP